MHRLLASEAAPVLCTHHCKHTETTILVYSRLECPSLFSYNADLRESVGDYLGVPRVLEYLKRVS